MPSRSLVVVTIFLMVACAKGETGPPTLGAEEALKLEDYLDAATIVGSEVPEDVPEPVEWRFDEPQRDWQPAAMMNPNTRPVKVAASDDALRIVLDDSNRSRSGALVGAIAIDLPDWDPRDWAHLRVRARSSGGLANLQLAFNTAQGEPSESRGASPFAGFAGDAETINDGEIHDYELPMEVTYGGAGEPWHRMGLGVYGNGPGSVEVLSVIAVPLETAYADAPTGVRGDRREPRYGRSTVYTHTPARIRFRVEIPPGGRFVTGLGVLRTDAAVAFKVGIEESGTEPTTLLEERHADPSALAQRSIDLSAFTGKTVTLVLETDAEDRGTVALWGAPTLVGGSRSHDADGGLIELPAHTFVTAGDDASDWPVTFSPDGDTLLFSRFSFETNRAALVLAPLTGGPPRRLFSSPPAVEASRMSWSPPPGRIAFTGFSDDGRAAIWLVEPDGSGLRALSSVDLSDRVFYPSWYPDGRHIAVVDYGGGEGGVLKRIDTRDGTVEILTDRSEVLAGKPSVSPHGGAIAFAGQTAAGQYRQSVNRIWLLDTDGLRELDPEQGRAPGWSPDGEWVVFESDRGSPNGNYALFAVPRVGGQALQLTSFQMQVNHPSWSPDGTRIAFSAKLNLDDPWRIALIDVPGW